MSDPFQVVRDFEQALCEYTGAPYAVTVNSCTMALLLAVKYYVNQLGPSTVTIPKKTYVGVPMSIINAGSKVDFEDKQWWGYYQLKPYPIFDCARWFSYYMYSGDPPYRENGKYDGNILCVSFHATKILGDTQGGAILHDNPKADKWFRKARFDGRTEGLPPKNDFFDVLGYHCYMSPDVAARLLHKLSVLPKHNDPLPNDDYPDLSQFEVFK